MRERMPDERQGKTHHFTIFSAKTPLDGAEGSTELEEIDGYITANTYADGRLGEIFIRMAKMGEATSGMVDAFATAFSIALQNGADLHQLVSKMKAARFLPYGATNNPQIPRCTSIVDYVGRWLELRFLPSQDGTAESSGTADGTAPGASEAA